MRPPFSFVLLALSLLVAGTATARASTLRLDFASPYYLGWAVESIEPEPFSRFELTVTAKDAAAEIRPLVEQTLRRFRVRFELRATSSDDVSYEVKVPLNRNTETVTMALTRVAPQREIDVKWDKKKDK